MWSVEKLFLDIRKQMPSDVKVSVFEEPYMGKGIYNRILNILAANKAQADINHITGDIHYISLGLSGKNTILTIHDLGFMAQHTGLKRWLLWFFWVYIPVFRVKYVVAISETTKAEIIKYAHCDPNKIKVITNFFSPLIHSSPKEFNTYQPVVLHIGTMFNKNLERLILALNGINCKLLVIGHLSNEQQGLLNDNQIEYENRFNLTENEIINAYRECDLLCFCSLLEGFGLPILEAQATGRAVVTSNLSSMPEVAGNSACFVDPHNVSAMREGIIKVISNESYRNDLVKKGYKNIKRFSLENVAKQYAELYQEVYQESKK
jgi:glycosyltransferase involved in cell wall biosynthesis